MINYNVDRSAKAVAEKRANYRRSREYLRKNAASIRAASIALVLKGAAPLNPNPREI